MGVLVFQEQFRNIDIGTVLIAFALLSELNDLKVRAADNVAYL